MTEEGAFVLLADIADDKGGALAEALGERATYVHCDVTSEPDVAAVVDDAVRRHGRLDCMFNNAGVVGASGPIDELTVEEYDFVQAVLLRSVFLGMKHAARVMKPQGAGVILSTTSIAGIEGGWGPHLYAAAKSAIVGLTRNVAAELATYGVRVVAIAPGKILSPMNAARIVGDPDDLEGLAAAFQSRTPLRGRVGTSRGRGARRRLARQRRGGLRQRHHHHGRRRTDDGIEGELRARGSQQLGASLSDWFLDIHLC